MTLVIGLHGAKGSGKDQFYKAIKVAFPELDIRKIAYADPIKDEVSRIFNLETEAQYDLFKRTQLSYTLPGQSPSQVDGRQVVREIGMLMRSYDQSQFVRYVQTEIQNNPNAIWCITDLRFANEIDSVRRLNGLIVKIRRKGVEFDGHATETEIPDHHCDVVIHNDEITLEQYNQLAVEQFERLKVKHFLKEKQ